MNSKTYIFFPPVSLDNKESSYLHGITSAGVTFQITKGCSQGNWDDCGCDSKPTGRGKKEGESSWEWGGCSENYRYGYEYSTKFMDPGKNADKTLFNHLVRHNNEAGRRVCSIFFLSFDEHRHVILDVILKNVYSCQLILWLVKRIIVIRNSKWFCGSL